MPAIDMLSWRWFISLAGALTIAGLVWFFGPLLAPFESWLVRFALVLLIVLMWAGGNYAIDQRQRRHDGALTEGVLAGRNEAAAVRDRWAAAVRALQKTGGYLYERPWYAIIGPPGAGKTTALLNAGLHFPLASKFGQDPVKGVGGTRHCDWWFTDDAVLIDTAGRYTTQDSDAVADRAGWEGFLDLLKTTRKRQPLNGVIVAIALSDIAGAADEERMEHARAIRRRVRELETRLGVRLPVYVVFTKADLIAGFSEFFDDLDGAQRGQVWGTTFDAAADESDCVDRFGSDFRDLARRLNDRLFDRMQAERNPRRRALIAMFPSQVASLEQPVAEFLKAAFGDYPLHLVPRLRGVYLSSATQEGTPFDRLTGVLARGFGLEQRRAAAQRPEQGRSYFLQTLLREVILGEAMLAAAPPALERRRMLLRTLGFAAVGLLVAGSSGYLWYLRGVGMRQAGASEAAVELYERAAQALPLDPVSDADLPRLLPLLDAAALVPLDAAGSGEGSRFSLGLSQQAKLAAGARVMYRHVLERTLLPALVWRLETQIRDSMDSPDFLYEATRIYLMLGGGGPLDRNLVHEWMRLGWQNMYPGNSFALVRERLLTHLDALLAEPLPAVMLDGDLVARARGTFGKVSLAQRAYSRIRLSASAQLVAPWRPSDSLNVVGMALFRRNSGKPLTEGIAGFYTVEGFHRVLLPSLARAARTVASESWVVGQRMDLDPNAVVQLERDVIGLYETDLEQAWDTMLGDLNMAPLTSVSQAAQDLYILGSPQSPVRALLASVARELTLSAPPGKRVDPPAGATQGAERAGLVALLGPVQSSAARPRPPGQEVDLRYAALRELVGSGGAAPIDQVLRSLNDMQQQFAKAAAAGSGSNVLASGNDPALAVKVEALRQPQPLARWLTTLANSGTALRGGDARR